MFFVLHLSHTRLCYVCMCTECPTQLRAMTESNTKIVHFHNFFSSLFLSSLNLVDSFCWNIGLWHCAKFISKLRSPRKLQLKWIFEKKNRRIFRILQHSNWTRSLIAAFVCVCVCERRQRPSYVFRIWHSMLCWWWFDWNVLKLIVTHGHTEKK